MIDADLVVDASGRGTRLPAWLDEWGFDRPREDTVDVGISYATHQVRMSDATVSEAVPAVIVAGASRRQPRGLGMLRYEDGTWIVTTFGVAKAQPPQDFSGMCALADAVLPAHISTALRSAAPIGPAGVPPLPHQPVAALRRDDPLPHRDRPVRRRRGQLQSDVRPRHDDDVHPGRQPARGAGIRRPRHRRAAVEGDGENHLSRVDDERHRRPDPASGQGRRSPGGTARSGACSTSFSVRPKRNPFWRNGFCAASASSTASTWCRRRNSSGAPSATTWRCGGPAARAQADGERSRSGSR